MAALWFIGGAGLASITVGGASYLTRLSLRGTLGMLAAIYTLQRDVRRRDRHTDCPGWCRSSAASFADALGWAIDCAHCNRGAARPRSS